MDFTIKQAIKTERMLEKGISKQDFERLRRNLQELINYALKLEKRIDQLEHPRPEKYY